VIHSTAIIDKTAKIGDNVSIGPYSIIGPNVEIGSSTKIASHVVIQKNTKIGKNNQISQFASIGGDPQDLRFHGEETYLEIGDNNIIRESCTISRGTSQSHFMTSIGSDNMFMAYTHIAHDCRVGNHIICANGVTLAGHVEIEDYVGFGGFAAIHQFCRIGKYSFIGASTLVPKDVLPYIRVAGEGGYAKPYGLNSIGLQRRGFSSEKLLYLKRAYKIIYQENLIIQEVIEQLTPMVNTCPEIQDYINMISSSKRGIAR
jgi:UDP-N-acetylglucosamine acyltransferase